MGAACSTSSTAVTPHDAPRDGPAGGGGAEYNDETRRAKTKEFFIRNQKQPVKRVEIRKLSGPMQARFIAALRRMMVGERDSVYCKISAIHGGSELTNPPTPLYCRHKFESFPSWHRAYLTEFELALQVADFENGGDGMICLPYWDWLTVGPGNTLPLFLCDVFPSACTVEFNRLSDEDVLASLRTSNLAERVDRALWGTEHSRVASTRGGPWSIEDPHNRVHVAVGGAMADVPTAAFDPMFWLHHCNVDRIYESYLRYDTDAESEFRANAKRESERATPLSPIPGGGDEYLSPLAPFVRSDDGKDWLNAQCFSTAKCGYVYDALVERRPQQLRESPVDVVFPGVEQSKMDGRGVDIVVFLHRKGTPPPTPPTEGGMRVWTTHPAFGGTASIFGRTGAECATCRIAEPYDLVVDVTDAVRRMGVDRNDVAFVAFASRPVHPRVLTPLPAALPPGRVRYPIFPSRSPTDLEPGATGDVVLGLQKWLARFGRIAAEEADGAMTGATDGAVRAIQQLIAKGIVPDGVVGPLTRKLLTQPRCAVPDGGDRASAQARVAASHTRSHHHEGGGKKAMKYAVGVPPGYLALPAVLADIDAAFASWGGPAGLKFERVAELGASDVVSVRWHSKPQAAERELHPDAAADAWLADEDHVAVFDGEGGTLARATHRGILFDMAERWYTGTGAPPAGYPHAVSLRAVCAHEIGHVLGLTHSDSLDEIMAPFYQTMYQPQAGDITRLKALLA